MYFYSFLDPSPLTNIFLLLTLQKETSDIIQIAPVHKISSVRPKTTPILKTVCKITWYVKTSGFARRAAQKTKMEESASHHVYKWGLAVCSPIVSSTMLKVRPRCTFTHFRTPLERSFSNLWSSSENHSSIFETLTGDFRHDTNSICS